MVFPVMRTKLCFIACLAALPAPVFAAESLAVKAVTNLQPARQFSIVVHNDAGIARPAETIVVPFVEVKRRLPDLQFDQLLVRDARSNIIPSQVTAMRHIHQGPPVYDDLLFQHDFALGEKRAVFTVETVPRPTSPIPSKVFARVVPERYDDFAWENDRIAHRAYGPGVEFELISSGLDLWAKKVRYSVIDRWYRKGHDGLHRDTGEGFDFYDVGSSRGVGGTGIWDGRELHVSKNWRTWKIYANGPLRAIFDLGYEDWDAGGGLQVRETKRFIVDAGHSLDEIHSRFDFTPSPGSDGAITVAIGLAEHPVDARVMTSQDKSGHWISVWEQYRDPQAGELGTGVFVAPETRVAGFARTRPSANGHPENLVLVKVKPGETIRYFAGGGWSKAGDFTSAAQWNGYLAAWAKRLAAPVRLELSGGGPL